MFMKQIRGKRAAYFGNVKTLERTHNFRIFNVSSTILIIKLVMIIILFMLATNSIAIKSYLPTTNTDYVLLIDDSSSMAKTDFSPNRLASAKDISLEWLTAIPNTTQIGVVGFSSSTDYAIPLTNNKELVRNTINKIEIDYSRSGTDLNYAINYGLDLLRNTSQKRTILLFTDGTQEVDNITILKAIDENVKIVSFGIGSINNSKVDLGNIPEEFRNTYSDLDLNFTILKDLSRHTNGQAYRVSNQLELQRSFEDATISQVKRSINTSYYVVLIIIIMSILELLVYAKIGAL